VEVHAGRLGVSETLRAFVAEMPFERGPIAAFLQRAALSVAPGARVADIGAGDAPYRELFEHTDYVTVDWEASPHEGAHEASVIASADDIPLPSESFDAVMLTQVLEHVPRPAEVLRELHRLLRPEGRLFLTAPLVWEEHEAPHDYYRYTRYGLAHLLSEAGFAEVDVQPRGDAFTTLAQLMRNVSWLLPDHVGDGLDERRQAAAELLRELAEPVAALAPLDGAALLPLGFTAQAVKPARA
jgi:SAM-dependent methyltransferase